MVNDALIREVDQALLLYLRRESNANVRDILSNVRGGKKTVQQSVKQLTRKGWIEEEEVGRSKLYRLTDQGLYVLTQLETLSSFDKPFRDLPSYTYLTFEEANMKLTYLAKLKEWQTVLSYFDQPFSDMKHLLDVAAYRPLIDIALESFNCALFSPDQKTISEVVNYLLKFSPSLNVRSFAVGNKLEYKIFACFFQKPLKEIGRRYKINISLGPAFAYLGALDDENLSGILGRMGTRYGVRPMVVRGFRGRYGLILDDLQVADTVIRNEFMVHFKEQLDTLFSEQEGGKS